jgi:hypothetical protein
VRRYAELGAVATDAVALFAADVRAGTFPSSDETYHMTDQLEGAIDMGPIDLVGDGATDPTDTTPAAPSQLSEA